MRYRGGDTIKVEVRDKNWHLLYKEKADINDKAQIAQIVSKLKSLGVDFGAVKVNI